MTDITVKRKETGAWVQGKREGDIEESRVIRGVFLPVSLDTLKYYPQGTINTEDMELFTKEKLEKRDFVILRGEEWKILQETNFEYIADVKNYILRRSDKND